MGVNKHPKSIGDIINGFEIIGRENERLNRRDNHIYWICKCLTCGNVIIIPSNKLTTRKCDKCKIISRFHDFNFSRKDNLTRGVYYRKSLNCYEVSVSYKKIKHFLGRFKDEEQAINIAKISYSFKSEDKLLIWFLRYKDIYESTLEYFNQIVDNDNFGFSDFIECIWNMESADGLVDKESRESLIDDYAKAFADQ